MSRRDEDTDLRKRFEALRSADAEIDPGFQPVRQRTPRPVHAERWVRGWIPMAAATFSRCIAFNANWMKWSTTAGYGEAASNNR